MRRPLVFVMSGLSVAVVGISLRASQAPASAGRAAASVAAVVTATTTRPPVTVTPAPSSLTPSALARVRATATPARATATAAPKRSAAPVVTVNGAAFDTRYGPVQVQIDVRAGRIIRADAIDYPQSGGRDQEINSYAVPQLDQEAEKAQSARIDTVSGATYTSDGYRQSLQSAIDAAHKAGAL